jgi:hypothetical protein
VDDAINRIGWAGANCSRLASAQNFFVDKRYRNPILQPCAETASTPFPNHDKEIFMTKGLERKKETKKKPLKTPKEKKAEKAAKKGK